jgi:hypothetical protein
MPGFLKKVQCLKAGLICFLLGRRVGRVKNTTIA